MTKKYLTHSDRKLRRLEVVKMLGDGKTIAEVASATGLSENTIQAYRSYSKTSFDYERIVDVTVAILRERDNVNVENISKRFSLGIPIVESIIILMRKRGYI